MAGSAANPRRLPPCPVASLVLDDLGVPKIADGKGQIFFKMRYRDGGPRSRFAAFSTAPFVREVGIDLPGHLNTHA